MVFGTLAALLLGTGARTSLGSLVAAVILRGPVLLTSKKEKTRPKIALVSAILVIAVVLRPLLSDFFVKGDDYGVLDQSTLSWRMQMWDSLFPLMLDHLWMGSGLNSFWNPDLFLTISSSTSGIHNGYLQVFQDLGLIGLLLLLVVHFPLFRALSIDVQKPHAVIIRYSLTCAWIYFFFVNLAESELGNYRGCIWGTLMTLSISWYTCRKGAN